MRFREFYTEAQQELQPGYSMFNVPGGETIQIPTAIRQKYNDQQILAMLQQQGYQVPAKVDTPAATNWHVSNPGPATPQAGQGAKIAPPAPAAQPAEQPPPGYRFMTLPNGNLVAVPQQLDDAKALDLIKRKRPDLLGAVAQSKKPVRVTIPADMQALPTADPKLAATAKKVADTYLGRALTPQEWDHLLRATYAESGHSEQEDAHIMATILNRARHGGFGGKNISSVLTQPSQFQSVSGTSKQDPKSDPNFIQGPPAQSLTTMLQGAIKHLSKVPKDIGYFTSNKEAAYKAGTDKKFLKKLRDAGAKLVGDTVFAKMDPQGHVYKPQPKPTTIAKK